MSDFWRDDEPEILRLGNMLDELDKDIDATDIRSIRHALLESLYLIQDHTHHASRILSQLTEALRLANRGKLHPLFATRQADKDRAVPAESVAQLEATAAAIIEYQNAQFGIPKIKTSEDIQKYLSKKGYRYADGKEYKIDTISRWPSIYQDPDEQAHDDYLSALEMLRKYRPNVDQPREHPPLGLINFILERSLLPLTGKIRRKY